MAQTGRWRGDRQWRTLTLGLALLCSGLAAQANNEDVVLLHDDAGITITAGEVLAEAQRQIPEQTRRCVILSKPVNIQTLLQQMYLRRVIVQRTGLQGGGGRSDAEEDAQKARVREDGLFEAWWREFDVKAEPSPEALQAWARTAYDAMDPQKRMLPARIRMQEISVAAEDADMTGAHAKALALLHRLRKGEVTLAALKDNDAPRGKGIGVRDLGEISLDVAPGQVRQALAELKGDGEFTQPLQDGEKGYCILYREEWIPERQASFEEAREALENAARQKMLQKARMAEAQNILVQARLAEPAVAETVMRWSAKCAKPMAEDATP